MAWRRAELFREFRRAIGISAVGGAAVLAVFLISSRARPVAAEAVDPSPQAPKSDGNDLVVHEWGTFLAMSDSDGTVLDGMYHEEHGLPDFVHSRAKDQIRLPMMILKGETPVIYFYTKNRMNIRVGVRFPTGVWTQWHPQAAVVEPPILAQAENPDSLAGGRICWLAELIPPGQAPATLSATKAGALWNHSRAVDAAYVKTFDATRDPATPEYERFLFYRGLGQTPLPVRFEAKDGGTLTAGRLPVMGKGLTHVLAMRIEKGRGAFAYQPAVAPGESLSGLIPTMDDAAPIETFSRQVSNKLKESLVQAGLYAKEAEAMVNTWKTSYFETDGVRVLFVMPQTWTDSFIPLTMAPRPRETIRVMVGRIELLTEDRERAVAAAVERLADPDPAARRDAYQALLDQGRYAEPILRKVMRATQDPALATSCRRLLATEVVREIKAAVNNAADGRRLVIDPLALRAQLARLLRDIGSNDEARAEGTAVLAELARAKSPRDFEMQAAALAGIGDDAGASYACVHWFAQFLTMRKGVLDARAVQWLRDCSIGRLYIQSLKRQGRLEDASAALLERLMLGCDDYQRSRTIPILRGLALDAQGDRAAAEKHWRTLAAPTPPAAVAKAPGA